MGKLPSDTQVYGRPDQSSREPNPQHDSLAPYVLRGVFDDNGLDLEFYKEAIKRFEDDEAIPALFSNAMVEISNQLSKLAMDAEYKSHVQVSLAGHASCNFIINSSRLSSFTPDSPFS